MPLPALRHHRVLAGLTQAELAAAAGISRQALHAIEAGRAVPSVAIAIRIARIVGRDVETIFAGDGSPPTLRAELVSSQVGSATLRGARVALTRIDERWIAHPLDGDAGQRSADGTVIRARGKSAEIAAIGAEAAAARNVIVAGCAIALGVLADRAGRGSSGRAVWLSRSSTAALEALDRGQVHVAGVHLVDPRTGDANVADVRRIAGRRDLVLVTLARWEAGLVVAAGNPKKITGLADAARRGLRLCAREVGSGARRLFDQELRASGMRAIQGRWLEVRSPADVARAVAMGSADAGVATRDVALASRVDFVPIVEERYDLCTTPALLADPRVARLFEEMTGAAFRAELVSLGYDPAPCGDRVAELTAA